MSQALLLSLFGDDSPLSDQDRAILSNRPSVADLEDMAGRYPEYMGLFAEIADVVKNVVGTIQKGVSAKKQREADAKAKKAAIQAANDAQAKILANQKRNVTIAAVVGGGGALVVGAIYLLKGR